MNLVICGDSFNVGIGLKNIVRDRYSQLVANHFHANLIMLARGSSSNYGVFLQAQYAANLNPKPDVVIMSVTSYDRIEWLKNDVDSNHVPFNITLQNLNYHDYPPHNYPQPHHDDPLSFYLQQDSNYNPIIFTEQVVALHEHLDPKHKNHYPRFDNEDQHRLRLIRDYFVDVLMYGTRHVSPIKRDYDIALITAGYYMLKNKGVKTIVMSDDSKLSEFIPKQSILSHNWFKYAEKYPDTIGSLHANEEAHEITAKLLIEKINNYEKSN